MSSKDTFEQATATEKTRTTPEAPASSTPSSGLNLGGESAQGGASRNESEADRLRAELQRERVEHGRVKALSQTLSEKDREIKALKDEVAKLRTTTQDYLSMIPEELRASVDPDTVKVIGAVAKSLQDGQESEYRRREEERNAREERQRETERQARLATIDQKIEGSFPGFLRDTDIGGDKVQAWGRFLNSGHRNAVAEAYNSGNFDALSDYISLFLTKAGVAPRDVANGAVATPRPTSLAGNGGASAGSDKVYTFDEYSAALEKAGNDAREGRITSAQYNSAMDELNAARDGGRVKGRPV